MVKDVIEGIKKTEAQAAAIIDEARKKGGEIIARAREASGKSIEDARKRGAESVKEALKKAEEEASRRIDQIAAKEQEKRKALKQVSAGKVDKAVDVVIERILT